MEFKKLDLGDPTQKEFFERVYNASFPDRERRPLKYLYSNHTGDKPFTLCLIWDGNRPEGTTVEGGQTTGNDTGSGERPGVTTGDKCRPVGLLGIWHLPDFDYGEYFAIDPALRGQGTGQRALAMWLAQLDRPALIEVEPSVDPATGREDPTARRRIEFYTRNGFRLWDGIDYIQPTYHYNGVVVPMKLMTYGQIDLAAQWERIRVPFFREVYGVRKEQIPQATGLLRPGTPQK